jgi:hypothetical protein
MSSGNFHVKRSETAQLDSVSQMNGIRSTKWVRPPQGRSVLEIQTTHRPRDLQKVPENLNYLTPPLHWHWYQDEYFNIKEGYTMMSPEMH